MPGPQTQTPRGIEDIYGADEIFVISHWFTHAHEDDVVDLLAGQSLDLEELIDDLACMEIAFPTLESAGAKFAPVGATDLARHANSSPVRSLAVERGRGGNQYAFDKLRVRQAKKKFLRGVLGSRFADALQPGRGKFRLERTSQRRRQIRHFIPGLDAALVDPFQNLTGTVGRLPHTG